jgi:hypothetical protein
MPNGLQKKEAAPGRCAGTASRLVKEVCEKILADKESDQFTEDWAIAIESFDSGGRRFGGIQYLPTNSSLRAAPAWPRSALLVVFPYFLVNLLIVV